MKRNDDAIQPPSTQVGKTLPSKKSKGGKTFHEKYPAVCVRLTEDDKDVSELLKAAVNDKFAPNPAEALRRCARLFLMPMFGTNKRVVNAIEDIQRARRERGFAV